MHFYCLIIRLSVLSWYRSDSDDDGYDLQPLTADELKRRLMISM